MIRLIGVWLSLVERLVWDQDVAGSNPVTPSNYSAGMDLTAAE